MNFVLIKKSFSLKCSFLVYNFSTNKGIERTLKPYGCHWRETL